MITPMTHKAVNWTDGMKLSSTHFIASDQHTQDLVRHAQSAFINRYNYGLLPPVNGQLYSLEMQILQRPADQVLIQVTSCNALTADGRRIDISHTHSNNDQPLTHYHQLNTDLGSGKTIYNVFLQVNLFDRIPEGIPDPMDNPPRYPNISCGYQIMVLPLNDIPLGAVDTSHLTIGQFTVEGGQLQISKNYIPPCSSVNSHPSVIKYYDLFSNLINEIQQSAFRIADKTAQRENISPLGNNIRKVSEKLLDYLALNFFAYRNIVMQQPPVELAAYFSNLAHVFYTSIRLIEPKEREEMLRYFYEWRDITPGNFEELLARNIDLLYDHQDIFSTMEPVQELLKIMAALWNKLSTLEFIGQRRENIIVAEQQIVQQVQVKRSWTLLD